MEFSESRYQEANHSVFMYDTLFLQAPDEDDEPAVEGDWADEDDEDFDDQVEDRNDLNEIRAADDIGEPDPEDADHLPDDDLQ